jgi:RimJ/RimL family protein N-acetyltransferase
MVTIRPIQPEDAAAYAALLEQLDIESTFLLFEPGERTMTVDQWAELIALMQTNGESTILVAEDGGELVGFLRARGETLRRIRHNLYLVIAIRQSHQGKGIGTRLFTVIEDWAHQRHLHRLHLTVMTHNERAVALYQKMGFVIEGHHKDAMFVDGRFVNEYSMAKLLVA